MKDFRIPKPVIVITILFVLAGAVGAAAVYWVAKNPPNFSHTQHAPLATLPQPPAVASEGAPVAGTDGFLVLRLRAAAELKSASAPAAFEGSIENMGFAAACSDKVVALNMRAQDRAAGTEQDGSISEIETTICLPAASGVRTDVAVGEVLPVTPDMEPEDRELYERALTSGGGRARLFDTGRGLYEVFVGAVGFSSCATDCAEPPVWGTAALVGASKVSRALDAENYLFAVPLSPSAAVSLSATVPVER